MKKILVLFLLLFSVQAQAAGIYTTVARGTVTQANMKISAVNGTAFVDFSAADVLTTKLGHLLKIRDSSGRAIQGFIKAAGTGETLGDELITNGDFASSDGWTLGEGLSIGSGVLTGTVSASGVYGYRSYNSVPAVGTLLKATIDVPAMAGTVRIVSSGSPVYIGSSLAIGSSVERYGTKTDTSNFVGILKSASSTITCDNFSVKKVLTPSATGVTIVSTKGGSTYNFALKNSSFNYNDPSGYTYEIIKVNSLVLVDSDACANGDATINLTDGSASWACSGIDDSAYLDGKHVVGVYDAGGLAVLGWYQSAGAGAIVTTKSGSTQNWWYKNASFSTAGNFTRKIYYAGD